ncbi:hypothetical protein ACFLT9_06535 [Acidobacteriota bacterium]
MNSKITKYISALILFFLFTSTQIQAYPIFIYRPHLNKMALSNNGRITLHGEIFGFLQYPSTFPSYNDFSGEIDRWTFGFQNIIYFTDSTVLLAQLVTHDDGSKRTKFDWHFSLRQQVFENLVLIAGHDSNHDSENQSYLNGKSFYLNRNYIGFGIPFSIGQVYIEPFTWIMHTTNQPGHLDYSGEILKQEYGVRVGFWIQDQVGVHFQMLNQMEDLFSVGQSFLADLIIRVKVAEFLELSLGARMWKDYTESRLGQKLTYYKLLWGVVIPF